NHAYMGDQGTYPSKREWVYDVSQPTVDLFLHVSYLDSVGKDVFDTLCILSSATALHRVSSSCHADFFAVTMQGGLRATTPICVPGVISGSWRWRPTPLYCCL